MIWDKVECGKEDGQETRRNFLFSTSLFSPNGTFGTHSVHFISLMFLRSHRLSNRPPQPSTTEEENQSWPPARAAPSTLNRRRSERRATGAYNSRTLDPITSYGDFENDSEGQEAEGSSGKVAGVSPPKQAASSTNWNEPRTAGTTSVFNYQPQYTVNAGWRPSQEEQEEKEERTDLKTDPRKQPLRRLLVQTNAVSPTHQHRGSEISISRSVAQDGSREVPSLNTPSVRNSSSLTLRSVLANQRPEWFVSSLDSPFSEGKTRVERSPEAGRRSGQGVETRSSGPKPKRRVVSAPTRSLQSHTTSNTSNPQVQPTKLDFRASQPRLLSTLSRHQAAGRSASVPNAQPSYAPQTISNAKHELIVSSFAISLRSHHRTRKGDLRILKDGSVVFGLSSTSRPDSSKSIVRLWISPSGLKIRNISALPSRDPDPDSDFSSPSKLSSIPLQFLPQDLKAAYRHCSRWLDSIRSKIILGVFQVPSTSTGEMLVSMEEKFNITVMANGKEPDFVRSSRSVNSEFDGNYQEESKIQVLRRKGIVIFEKRTIKLNGDEGSKKILGDSEYSRKVLPLVERDFSLASSSSNSNPSSLSLSSYELSCQCTSLIFKSLDEVERSEILSALGCGVIVDTFWKAWESGIGRGIGVEAEELDYQEGDSVVEFGIEGLDGEMETPPVSKERQRRLKKLEKTWARRSLGAA